MDERCLNEEDDSCYGEITERVSAGGTCMIERCVKHWQDRDDLEDRLNRDYPDSDVAPAWFDPTYAGEHWNDDY